MLGKGEEMNFEAWAVVPRDGAAGVYYMEEDGNQLNIYQTGMDAEDAIRADRWRDGVWHGYCGREELRVVRVTVAFDAEPDRESTLMWARWQGHYVKSVTEYYSKWPQFVEGGITVLQDSEWNLRGI